MVPKKIGNVCCFINKPSLDTKVQKRRQTWVVSLIMWKSAANVTSDWAPCFSISHLRWYQYFNLTNLPTKIIRMVVHSPVFLLPLRPFKHWPPSHLGMRMKLYLPQIQSLLLLCLPEAVDTDSRVLRVCLQPLRSVLCGNLLYNNNNSRRNFHFRSQWLPPL